MKSVIDLCSHVQNTEHTPVVVLTPLSLQTETKIAPAEPAPQQQQQKQQQEEGEGSTAGLLAALAVKAAAFSDRGWMDHWNQSGPSLLARRWSSLHPHIPLSSLERATGVGFLVSAAREGGEGGEIGGIGEDGEIGGIGEDGEIGGIGEDGEIGGIGEDGEIGGIGEDGKIGGIGEDGKIGGIGEDGEIGGIGEDGDGEIGGIGEDVDGEIGGIGEDGEIGDIVRATAALEISDDRSHEDQVTPPTDDEIRRLWTEMYNTHYWYWYQRWTGEEGGCEEGGCEGEDVGSGEDEKETGEGASELGGREERGGGGREEGREERGGGGREEGREERGGGGREEGRGGGGREEGRGGGRGGGGREERTQKKRERKWVSPEEHQQRQ